MNPERNPTLLDPQVEDRVAEMRQMLLEMHAVDTAAALRSLRTAFPHVPLTDRVRALATDRH